MPKTHRQISATYRARHPEKIKAYMRTFSSRYSQLKSSAKTRGFDCQISAVEHCHLLRLPCWYCGGPLNSTGVGLDRLDHREGYTEKNAVQCCRRCNTRKGNLEAAGFVFPRTVELMQELLAKKA